MSETPITYASDATDSLAFGLKPAISVAGNLKCIAIWIISPETFTFR